MMASDSDESDYEDASQHHDNQVDVSYPPVLVPSGSSSAIVSSSRGENGHGERFPEELPEVEPAQPNPEQVEVIQIAEGPNRVVVQLRNNVVDSDEDDEIITISDDSDEDIPLRYEEGGESRGTSDSRDGEGDEDFPEFDPELPIRHTYLGDGMEALQGRVMLEEDSTPEIPLIAMGIHLIPGQTLPLTIFHAVFQNAIRRCVMTDRLFGIVHNDVMDVPSGSVVYKGALGTLAEIFEYQEEAEGILPNPMSSSFALKAKGRQRFNVIDVRRQADGNLMGRVKVRPEIRLEPFVLNIILPGGISRNLLPKYSEETDEPDVDVNVRPSSSVSVPASPATSSTRSGSFSQLVSRFSFGRRDSVASTVSKVSQSDKDLARLQTQIPRERKRLKYYSAFTPHPYFVYEQYDETVLVEKVHRLLKTELKGLTLSHGKIPVDATDLSFWLAQNLTMDDSHRTKILKMDSPIQRLKYELELLAKTTKVISCRNCQTNIADHSQIFSMSVEGPQGTYVNPHGFVHETLTVYKAGELITRGVPSTEASWFPGYSWIIVECKRCRTHVGWRFQAVDRLKPSRFWGLARRSVIFKYDFGSDSDLADNLDVQHRTPPNSANSEAFSTFPLF